MQFADLARLVLHLPRERAQRRPGDRVVPGRVAGGVDAERGRRERQPLGEGLAATRLRGVPVGPVLADDLHRAGGPACGGVPAAVPAHLVRGVVVERERDIAVRVGSPRRPALVVDLVQPLAMHPANRDGPTVGQGRRGVRRELGEVDVVDLLHQPARGRVVGEVVDVPVLVLAPHRPAHAVVPDGRGVRVGRLVRRPRPVLAGGDDRQDRLDRPRGRRAGVERVRVRRRERVGPALAGVGALRRDVVEPLPAGLDCGVLHRRLRDGGALLAAADRDGVHEPRARVRVLGDHALAVAQVLGVAVAGAVVHEVGVRLVEAGDRRALRRSDEATLGVVGVVLAVDDGAAVAAVPVEVPHLRADGAALGVAVDGVPPDRHLAAIADGPDRLDRLHRPVR